MSSPDIHGNKWVLGAACYKTATILCALMKNKSDAPRAWKGFIETIKSMDFVLRRVRIDNDSVFLSALFTEICQTNSINIERTVPYSHWQLERI